jgi:hypothetical protein
MLEMMQQVTATQLPKDFLSAIEPVFVGCDLFVVMNSTI